MRCFRSALRCSHIILNTYDALEAESLEFVRSVRPGVLTVGPLLPSLYLGEEPPPRELGPAAAAAAAAAMWVEDDGCLAWLDEQEAPRSVLYVSFGSIALVSAQQMEELAAALEASRYPILMVAREVERHIPGAEDQVAGGLPESFARAKNVMVVKWAPQLKVLAHPAIGGFLTHCGWNSTMEAICKGVPMLCWPFFVHQMLNCRLVVDSWRIGLEFDRYSNNASTSLVNREEIEAKVRHLMDPSSSKGLRERASKLSTMAMEAHHGSSKDNFNSFIRFLLGR